MQAYDEKLGEFSRKADLLIHDACFTDDDWQNRPGEGHCCPSVATEFAALQAEVKNLLLFHYDGSYGDETIDLMKIKAEELARENGWPTVCHAAKEGFTLTLD
jgi:ribonuclease BN (tRNA processing enzyme)